MKKNNCLIEKLLYDNETFDLLFIDLDIFNIEFHFKTFK